MKTSALTMILCGLSMATGAMAQLQTGVPGAVFAATNDVTHNEVIMYHRSGTGKLQLVGRFPTRGRGEGGINDPLQSSNSLLLSSDHRYLLAVNAGSSTISVFRVFDNFIFLTDVKPSGGGNPVSITMHDDLVYVVNVGGTYHTAGFRLQPYGELEPIRNSKQPLSGLDTEPATILFSPDGSKLVITERQTNKIDVFTVQPDGSLANPVFTTSQGVEPFGAQFTPSGLLLVTETNGGPPAIGSMSSYTVNADNSLTVVSSKATAVGGATCWVANNGTQAWVSNTTSSNVAAYTIAPDGTLASIGVKATEAATGPTIFPPVMPPTSFPIDLALSADHNFLYVVFSALGQIYGYQVRQDGSLTAVDAVSPYQPQTGVEGLAVY